MRTVTCVLRVVLCRSVVGQRGSSAAVRFAFNGLPDRIGGRTFRGRRSRADARAGNRARMGLGTISVAALVAWRSASSPGFRWCLCAQPIRCGTSCAYPGAAITEPAGTRSARSNRHTPSRWGSASHAVATVQKQEPHPSPASDCGTTVGVRFTCPAEMVIAPLGCAPIMILALSSRREDRPFHGGNRGSNPLADAAVLLLAETLGVSAWSRLL